MNRNEIFVFTEPRATSLHRNCDVIAIRERCLGLPFRINGDAHRAGV